MQRVLLIGNGAREHAIAEAVKRSAGQVHLYTFAKSRNPGIMHLSEGYEIGDLMDFAAIEAYAKRVQPDFAVIGSDDPIGGGLADVLMAMGVPSVAPRKALAQLESSKSFTRDLLAKYGIPGNPKFRVFHDLKGGDVRRFVRDELGGSFVVKADGLMAGKGVAVSGDHFSTVDEGLTFAQKAIEKFGRVVIEEKLVGQEFSLMSFCDGVSTAEMPVVQDHKRAFEGDKGPNTGGMGTYSAADHLLPFLSMEDVEAARDITKAVMEALRMETGDIYQGVMYGGFMAVADGVRLIEYNARFGDPEALNVLPILETDFVDVCRAIIDRSLATMTVRFANQATVCKYVAPEGYPDKPVKNAPIEVGALPAGVRRYDAAIDERDGRLFLQGGRAIGFVGIADTIATAEQLAQKAVAAVKGPIFYRRDIGTRALIDARVAMMRELRGV